MHVRNSLGRTNRSDVPCTDRCLNFKAQAGQPQSEAGELGTVLTWIKDKSRQLDARALDR